MLAQYQQALNQHRQRVYSFAYYSLRTAADAEDVTQEVFIRLWQHWGKIDHQRLGGWLMRVAHNSVVDHIRKTKNGEKRIDQFADVEAQQIEGQEQQAIEQTRFKAQLEQAIKTLSEPYRSIVIMRDIQGASYTDIQHCLDLSQSQVKVYLHRGRAKLRQNPQLRKLATEKFSGAGNEVKHESVNQQEAAQVTIPGKSDEEGLSHAKQ